ncbi:MAG: hypothetical protein KF734_17475 [Saprospiraceae bacterium]|nr:hypothetical protein [Saprospiraceae bacterium]
MARPLAFYPLFLLLLLLGISAAFGGWVLMTQPETFGMPPEWLSQSPFGSFFLPGLILFVFNGLFPLFAAAGLLLKPNWPWANIFNIYHDRHWGWAYSLFSGIIIIIWITVQITMVASSWLQPAYLAVGLLILIFTLWPSTMRHYQIFEK